MISYGGVPLLSADPELVDWVAENVDPAYLSDFVDRAWPGPVLSEFDGPPQWPKRRVRVNSLYWPTGASRFAVGYFLTSQVELDKIRPQAFTGPTTWNPLPLVLNDQTRQLTTNLLMLPARPLQQTVKGTSVALLTLVDDRYLWWTHKVRHAITSPPASWLGLYSDIAKNLNTTIIVDTIPAAYLAPPQDLSMWWFESLPVILDMVAACVQQRIVRQLDGTMRAWNAANAVAQDKVSIAAVGKVAGPVKEAGGTFKLGQWA